MIEEARVDHHNGVSHGGQFGALDEVQLWTVHHDGVPEERHGGEAQRLQQLHQLVFHIQTSFRGLISQTEDLRDLQQTAIGKTKSQ